MQERQSYAIVILERLQKEAPFSHLVPIFQTLANAVPQPLLSGAVEQGLEEPKRCERCANFRATKQCLILMESGTRILGQCDTWNTPLFSSYGCTQFERGEPGYL